MIGCFTVMAISGFFLVLTMIGSLIFGDGDAAEYIARTMFMMENKPEATVAYDGRQNELAEARMLRKKAFEMRSELNWMTSDLTGRQQKLVEAQIRLLEDMANLLEARGNQMEGRVIAILRNAVDMSQKRVDRLEAQGVYW